MESQWAWGQEALGVASFCYMASPTESLADCFILLGLRWLRWKLSSPPWIEPGYSNQGHKGWGNTLGRKDGGNNPPAGERTLPNGSPLIATRTGIIHLDCSPGMPCIFLSLSSWIFPCVSATSSFLISSHAPKLSSSPLSLVSGSLTGQSMDFEALKSDNPRAVLFF